MTVRQLIYAQLDTQIQFDRSNPNIMPMSTLIASDQFKFDAEWDGARIGDVSIYINKKATAAGAPMKDANGNVETPEWEWYGGVPCARVRCYRWANERPFVPFAMTDAERKAKPGQAGKEAPARA